MAVNAIVNQRKRRRRRRRRQDKPAISAHLVLDDRVKGHVGILSDDLFADLFPGAVRSSDDTSEAGQNRIHHVAITPWLPTSAVSPSSASWTILPVRSAAKDDTTPRAHSSIQFPARSLALQSFVNTLQALNRMPRKDIPIEIRILDVVPFGLDTVFVSIDSNALSKLDEVKEKYGGGFGAGKSNGTGGKKPDPAHQEREWRDAVRKALQAPNIVHAGDQLPLPIAGHPITHRTPPPAKVLSCEPVAQGLLLPSTRVVVLHSRGNAKSARAIAPSPRRLGGSSDDDDTTSFYSANEEGLSAGPSPPSDEDASTTDRFESEASGTEADDLSDDSEEDMISLSTPSLPPQSSGVLSAWTCATPRAGDATHGIMSPGAGSVYSTFTSATARGGSRRVFKATGLLEKIPEEMLHPKPGSEDDEEARVFVDTNTLVKIGCFSGDWVRIEPTEGPRGHGLSSWGLSGAFGGEDESKEFRALKIFGLPEVMSKKRARYSVARGHQRHFSHANHVSSPSGQAYLSPLLLTNLGNPSHLRISALQSSTPSLPKSVNKQPKITASSLPPFAAEVTIVKVSTPLSMEKSLQPSLFTGLKDFFEQKRRILKSGDLVAIAIDEDLGRAVFQGSTPEGEMAVEELLSTARTDNASHSGSRPKSVAWFKVGSVTPAVSAEARENGDFSNDIWGGVVSVDATNTKMKQAGSEQGRVPSAMSNSWQYYLGAKRAPASSGGATSKPTSMSDLPKPYVSALRRRVRELVSAATSPRAMHLGLPPLALLLTSSQRQIGKTTTVTKACEDLGLHAFSIDAFDILTEGAGGGDVKTETTLKARAERVLACGPEHTALVIKHIDALNADRMVSALREILADSRVLIATSTEADKIPDGIRGLFTHELEMSAPDEGEREGILNNIVEDRGIRLSPDVDLSNIAVKTAALVAGDLVDVLDRALVVKRNRLDSLISTSRKYSTYSDAPLTIQDLEVAGGPSAVSLTCADLIAAVEAARKNFADAIGAPKIPNVQWSDVGGLGHVKDAVTETIQLPLSRPELFARGMKKRSGILFYGPPGTGKTLLAKAIATSFSLNFFSVKGPELLNMYIGESEANVRRVFQRARDARPCVVFFDELDSVAPKRGNQGDSGGVMDRIVSQLLAELDGMSDGDGGGGGVFVIGATNRPDLLDQALLRPGRFDKMLYLGVSDTHDKQLTILEALTRKFTLDPTLSLRNVASSLPFTFTGADLYALCSDAMLHAITRQARAVDARVASINASRAAETPPKPPISTAYFFDHFAADADTAVVVTEDDFVSAKRELVPSVSADELQHYERVRRTFEEGGKEGKGGGQARAQAQAQAPPPVAALRISPAAPPGGTTPSADGKQPSAMESNGKGKGKGKAAAPGAGTLPAHEPTNGARGVVHNVREVSADDDDEDEYVIRTDHLINGSSNASAVASTVAGGDANNGEGKGNGKGKGKGKGKGNHDSSGFGDAAEGDEDMYA
ncbi:peroxin 6 [Phyllosticta citriasiana]|uniref:Peroxisomal ATPase PEX6 n=1 Tax=Phyllosticta citriasiana TaxID=595635 RepID=A0ABR1KVB0_9PEZI